jgi:hypothetical protein
MEMPGNCAECRMKKRCKQGIDGGWREDKRVDDCPLVEIATSEWQQDHAILKAHADGANEVIDRIKRAREEVANYSDFHREHLYKTNPNYDVEQGRYLAYEKCLQILDDMIAEVEGKDATERK